MEPSVQHSEHDRALSALLGELTVRSPHEDSRTRTSLAQQMGASTSSSPPPSHVNTLYHHPTAASTIGSSTTTATMGSYNYLQGVGGGLEYPHGSPIYYSQSNPPTMNAVVMSKHSSAPIGSGVGSASGRDDSSPILPVLSQQQQQHQQQLSQWMATAAAMGIPSHLLLGQQHNLQHPTASPPSQQPNIAYAAAPGTSTQNPNNSLSIATSLLMDYASEGSTTISHHTNTSNQSVGGFTGAGNRSNVSYVSQTGVATNMSAVASAGSTGISGGTGTVGLGIGSGGPVLGLHAQTPQQLYAHPYAAAAPSSMANSANIVSRAGEMAALMAQNSPNPANAHPMFSTASALSHQQHPAFQTTVQRQQQLLPSGMQIGEMHPPQPSFLPQAYPHPQQHMGDITHSNPSIGGGGMNSQLFLHPTQQKVATTTHHVYQYTNATPQQMASYSHPQTPQTFASVPNPSAQYAHQQPQQQFFHPGAPSPAPVQMLYAHPTALPGVIPIPSGSPSFLHPAGAKLLSSSATGPKTDKITASTIPLDEEAARERKKHLQAKRKTAFCHFYPDNIHLCPFGDQCAFAHNKDERSVAKDKWGKAMDNMENEKKQKQAQK